MRLINETYFESGLSEAELVIRNLAPLVMLFMASQDLAPQWSLYGFCRVFTFLLHYLRQLTYT